MVTPTHGFPRPFRVMYLPSASQRASVIEMEEPILEPPEAPGLFGYVRYGWHYLASEGGAIRRAPLSFAIAMVVIGAPLIWLVTEYVKSEEAKQIEDLRAANESLDATIKSLEATVQLQDRKIMAFTGGTTTVGENQNSRIQYITATRIPPPLPYKINILFANKGNAAAIGVNFRGSAQVSESALSEKNVDAAFDNLEEQLRTSATSNTSETQPQDTIFNTITADNITSPIADMVQAGRARVYTFGVMRYRDENTPPGKHRITEVCLIGMSGSADHFCPNHNRVFLSD
jgi:hypothetical protein